MTTICTVVHAKKKGANNKPETSRLLDSSKFINPWNLEPQYSSKCTTTICTVVHAEKEANNESDTSWLIDSSKLINTGDLEQTPYRYLKPPLSAQEFKIL